ncbi:MAG: hypothetical protein N4A36_00515 [Candidatus Gracilibacteria bacterium]|jgi:hypothetical protein|nr:hypothetical protein [Candidatus Gracilibacteria bacterium]
MKKFLIVFVGILLIPQMAWGKGLYGTKAREVNNEINELYKKIGKIDRKCDTQVIRANIVYATLEPGSFVEFFQDPFRAACLREDLYFLEDNLADLVNRLSISEISCHNINNISLENVLTSIKKIQKDLRLLRKYAQDQELAESNSKEEFYDKVYLDSNCSQNTFQSVFRRLNQSFKELTETIEYIQDNSFDDLKKQAVNIDHARIQKNAQKKAQKWMKKMMPDSFSGDNSEFGWTYDENEAGVHIFGDEVSQFSSTIKSLFKSSPSKDQDRDYLGKPISEIQKIEQNEKVRIQFEQDLEKFVMMQDISDQLDVKTVNSISATIHCTYYALNQVADEDYVATSWEKMNCKDPLSMGDSLESKTRSLKSLLKAHNN